MSEQPVPDAVDELQRELIKADRERLAWQRLFAQSLFLFGGTNRTLDLTSQFLNNWHDDDWTLKRFEHNNGVTQFALRARERPKGETVCHLCRGRKSITSATGTKPCPKCS